MKYTQLKIKPSVTKDDWEITEIPLKGDREEGQENFSAIGHCCYQETTNRTQAFTKLKNIMIERHEEEIEDLIKSLDKLRTLTLPQ